MIGFCLYKYQTNIFRDHESVVLLPYINVCKSKKNTSLPQNLVIQSFCLSPEIWNRERNNHSHIVWAFTCAIKNCNLWIPFTFLVIALLVCQILLWICSKMQWVFTVWVFSLYSTKMLFLLPLIDLYFTSFLSALPSTKNQHNYCVLK